MKFFASTIASLALVALTVAEDATVTTYSGSGCSGDSKKIQVGDSLCVEVQAGSVKAQKGDIGVKWTCNQFTDSSCSSGQHEIDYTCGDSSNGVTWVSCYENPPL